MSSTRVSFYPDMSELSPEARARSPRSPTKRSSAPARDRDARSRDPRRRQLLGDEQYGHVAAPSGRLYVENDSREVGSSPASAASRRDPVRVDARVDAYVPPEYIASASGSRSTCTVVCAQRLGRRGARVAGGNRRSLRPLTTRREPLLIRRRRSRSRAPCRITSSSAAEKGPSVGWCSAPTR